MSHPYELHRFVLIDVPTLTFTDIVLDVGCGCGLWGFLIRCDRSKNHVYLVGIDVHKEAKKHYKKIDRIVETW